MKINQHLVGIARHSSRDIFLTDRCSGAFLIHVVRAALLTVVLAVVVVLVTGSVFGFLRFIPPSRYHANAVEAVTDLSSASVMGRQVLEDTISFFYLSEPDLSDEEKSFRRLVWKFHGKSENIDSARLAGVANVEQSPVWTECEQLGQEVNNHAILPLVKPERMRHNVSKGYEAHILHDHEILKRRGIWIERYDLPHKVLSNFAQLRSKLCCRTGACVENLMWTFASGVSSR
jgi:hypothetical protein